MKTFTAQELSDFYQKVADGGEISYHSHNLWVLCPCNTRGPKIGSPKDVWRIKPTKKVIDLSVLIGSQIDCEFSLNGEFWYVDKLSQILREGYSGKVYAEWKYCRPRMNHKHAWQGGECPLPEGFMVNVWFRNNQYQPNEHLSASVRWEHDGDLDDIIAFEVLGLADGYVMPWEGE